MSDPKGVTVSSTPAVLTISGVAPRVELPDLPPEVKFLAQHKEHAERGAALVLAAQLDEAVAEAIKARLIDDPAVRESMFREMQPLGSFGARVRMAYLMGVCGKEAYRDLILISKIRNEFAHKPEPKDFKDSTIIGLCSSIRMMKIIKGWDDGIKPNDIDIPLFKQFQDSGLNVSDLRFRFVRCLQVYRVRFNLVMFAAALDLSPQPLPSF